MRGAWCLRSVVGSKSPRNHEYLYGSNVSTFHATTARPPRPPQQRFESRLSVVIVVTMFLFLSFNYCRSFGCCSCCRSVFGAHAAVVALLLLVLLLLSNAIASFSAASDVATANVVLLVPGVFRVVMYRQQAMRTSAGLWILPDHIRALAVVWIKKRLTEICYNGSCCSHNPAHITRTRKTGVTFCIDNINICR